MTVKELIKALQKQPQNAEVSTEGCDCYGDVVKVTHEKDSEGDYVLLRRE